MGLQGEVEERQVVAVDDPELELVSSLDSSYFHNYTLYMIKGNH